MEIQKLEREEEVFIILPWNGWLSLLNPIHFHFRFLAPQWGSSIWL